MTTGRPQLAPGTHRADITARVQKNGSWRVKATVRRLDGEYVTLDIRGRTKWEAEAKFRQKAKEHLRSLDAPASTLTPDSTVTELVLVWADHVDKQGIGSAGTRHENRRLIRNHIGPHFARVAIREVNSQVVLAWYQELETRRSSTSNKCLNLLRRGFKHGMHLAAIDWNPATDIASTRRQRTNVIAPEAMELSEFRRKIAEYNARPDIMGPKPTRDLLDYVDVILGTGARPGEACGLLWDEIDLQSAPARLSITGQVQEGKGQKKGRVSYTETGMGLRTISLSDVTAAVLRERRLEQPNAVYVFETRTGQPTGPQQFNARIRRVRDFAGLSDDLVPSALRRTVLKSAFADDSHAGSRTSAGLDWTEAGGPR